MKYFIKSLIYTTLAVCAVNLGLSPVEDWSVRLFGWVAGFCMSSKGLDELQKW